MEKPIRVLGKRGRITIPQEIREQVGFRCNEVLSFDVTDDGDAVVIRREKLCTDCKKPSSPSDGEVTLQELLNSLSYQEQCAAMVQLSVNLAAMQGGGNHG